MLRIVEVGPRDGLQNEKVPIPTALKLSFIENLKNAGLKEIEATSFVSPKWVPQLGDAAELWSQLPPGPTYSALVPNVKGLQRALECGVGRICFFTAASEAFTQKNINMTIEESLVAFEQILDEFRQVQPTGHVRAYLSTAFECPYAGRTEPGQALSVARRLVNLGADEVSVGDTIGVAVPKEVEKLTHLLLEHLPKERVAYHFHDTRGTALANVAEAYRLGITTFDSSAGGLGGCPYAPGAGGNLATEDLIYFFERSGVATGVKLQELAQASLPVLGLLGRSPQAKAQIAVLASQSCPQ